MTRQGKLRGASQTVFRGRFPAVLKALKRKRKLVLGYILGLYGGYMGIMEKKMETTTTVYLDVSGSLGKGGPHHQGGQSFLCPWEWGDDLIVK